MSDENMKDLRDLWTKWQERALRWEARTIQLEAEVERLRDIIAGLLLSDEAHDWSDAMERAREVLGEGGEW